MILEELFPEFKVLILRLNSGIKNRSNFFAWAIFLIQKVWTDSVIYVDSGDIKILVQYPGNLILKILQNFWKCVGGVYTRGCLILKITQNVRLFTLINFIYNIRGIHLISCQPTQLQPRNFRFLVGFSFETIFAPSPPTTTLVSKDVEFSCASFEICKKFARWCPPTQTPTQKFKSGISIFSSQGISSSLVSFGIFFWSSTIIAIQLP